MADVKAEEDVDYDWDLCDEDLNEARKRCPSQTQYDTNNNRPRRDTTASQSHLKPIPKEQAFLETFFYTIAQFAFDRARELADKERDSLKASPPSLWSNFVTSLSSFATAEKNYFTLGFVEKRLLRRDPLRSLYTGLASDLKRQESASPTPSLSASVSSNDGGLRSSHEALVNELSKHLNQFALARQRMIDFYELMSRSGWSHSHNTKDLIEKIKAIGKEFGTCFHHPILDPLKTSFGLEVDVVMSLFQAESEMSQWDFLKSLLLLRECQAKISSWCLLSPSTSVKEQLLASIAAKTFFSRQGNKRNSDVPFLYHWLQEFYEHLVSKFTFYFYTTLSAQTSSTEMKTLTSKCSIDFISKLQSFQRRTDAYNISLILETHRMDTIFKGHGYHLNNTIREHPHGMDSYPSVVCIPEKRPLEHWPNVISIMNDHCQELQNSDKIIYFYDQKMDSCYYMVRVDLCAFLVVIYNSKKKEKDNTIQTTLSEIRGLLNHDKLYQMLKPGQGQKFLA